MTVKPFEDYYDSLEYLEKEYANLKKLTEKLKKMLDEKEKVIKKK